MKFNNKQLHYLILSSLIALIFTSCEVSWFANFKDTINPDISTKITFYSVEEASAGGDPVYTTSNYYRNGEVLNSGKLPGFTDSTVASWNPNARLAGWHFYRTTDQLTDMTSDGVFDSYTPDGTEIDLYALWYYGYYIATYFEDVSGNPVLTGDPVLDWGNAGESTNILPSAVEGFTPIVENVTVDKTVRNTAKVIYNRNEVTLHFDPNGGELNGSTAISDDIKKYGLSLSISDPVKAGYTFKGWLPPLSSTVPAVETTYVAQWQDCEFTLSYADWNAGLPDAKACSADISNFINSLPATYSLGIETELPNPISTATLEDKIEFAGYFYDADCTNSLSKNASGKYCLKNTDTGDKTIYLKWKYKVVYVDPINGDDTNTGHNETNPVKTIFEAKKYLACGQDDSSIVLISELSDSAQISALSGISTTSYHNAKLVNSSLGNSLISVTDNVTLKDLVIESNAFSPGITVSNGVLTIDNLTANVGSFGAISLKNSGSLLISGIYNYNSTSDTSSAVQIDSACSGSLYMSGSGKINSSNPVILSDGQKITISGPLTQSGIVATIKSDAPSTSPVVLTDSVGGTHVSSYYKMFSSANAGYNINSAGQLVKSSSIDLDPSVPSITEYDPGELETTVITKVSGGDTIVTFKVSDEAYDKIALSGTEKYIQYTIDGVYGNVKITGSAGNYIAELNLTSLQSGTELTVTPVDLKTGLHSLVIYAEANDSFNDVINTKEYQIFVK